MEASMLRHRRALPILLSVAVSLGLAACGHAKQDDPRTEPPLVRTATVQTPSRQERSFTGVVVARVESDLGFRVPGKIVERLVDTGQTVKKGQVLMRIDPIDLTLANDAQAEAVAAAKARALQTSADEQRYKDLVAAGAVSASAYDQIKAAADAARAQLNATQAQARVTHNAAGYAELLADSDGVIMETLVEPGRVVAAGQTVIRLAHAGPREASIDLPETLRPAIGSQARAQLYSAGSAFGTAHLRQLSDAANPLTRTFEARYVLDGAAANAPLGATVSVQIPDSQSTTVTTVPLSALYDQGNGPGVWVVDPKARSVSWRKVQIAALGSETASVSQGMSTGDRFVTLGAHLLHEGEVVNTGDGEKGAAQ
jgi:RND family efflux transporter MFP subunit